MYIVKQQQEKITHRLKHRYIVLCPIIHNNCYLTYQSSHILKAGQLVLISIRKNKKIGIIIKSIEHQETDFEIKDIDDHAALYLSYEYLRFIEWFANYNFTFAGRILHIMQSMLSTWYKHHHQHHHHKNHTNKQITQIDENKSSIQSEHQYHHHAEGQGQELCEDIEYKLPRNSTMNAEQKNAFNIIQATNKPTVLYGVTGSGKTHVYHQCALDAYNAGKQVLILCPEIHLAKYMAEQFNGFLWSSSSKKSSKTKIWHTVACGKPIIIIGTRSAIFLPFTCLGLIVIDEEHDESYQQDDNSLRYNCRDMSVKLARIYNAQIVLVSATPSLSTYYNVKKGIYQMAKLQNRFQGYHMPSIQISKIEHSDKLFLNDEIYAIVKDALLRNETALVFLNRRGYEKILLCKACKYVYVCDNCSVLLTYHQQSKMIQCSKCSTAIKFINKCIKCGDGAINFVSCGIEKIAEYFNNKFCSDNQLKNKVIRIADRTTNHKVITDFQKSKIDLLIGTQVISKGLTFKKLNTVIIMDIDFSVQSIEYRAIESMYNKIHQISGRAGRTSKQKGVALISTAFPNHEYIQKFASDKYFEFANHQLDVRMRYALPPFSGILKFEIKNKDYGKLDVTAKAFYDLIIKYFDSDDVVGPIDSVISKQKGIYKKLIIIYQYTVTIQNNKKVRAIIDYAISEKIVAHRFSISVEVNPLVVYS